MIYLDQSGNMNYSADIFNKYMDSLPVLSI